MSIQQAVLQKALLETDQSEYISFLENEIEIIRNCINDSLGTTVFTPPEVSNFLNDLENSDSVVMTGDLPSWYTSKMRR